MTIQSDGDVTGKIDRVLQLLQARMAKHRLRCQELWCEQRSDALEPSTAFGGLPLTFHGLRRPPADLPRPSAASR